jgi:hypothetical protein
LHSIQSIYIKTKFIDISHTSIKDRTFSIYTICTEMYERMSNPISYENWEPLGKGYIRKSINATFASFPSAHGSFARTWERRIPTTNNTQV